MTSVQKSASDFIYRLAAAEDYYRIKHFLKTHNTYSANRDDWIFTVSSANNQLVGIARLLNIPESDNALWLRGLFIAESFRHQGIASGLLAFMHQQLIDQPEFSKIERILAFSETHLEGFYLSNNYQLIAPSQTNELLPEYLLTKLHGTHAKTWLSWQRLLS